MLNVVFVLFVCIVNFASAKDYKNMSIRERLDSRMKAYTANKIKNARTAESYSEDIMAKIKSGDSEKIKSISSDITSTMNIAGAEPSDKDSGLKALDSAIKEGKGVENIALKSSQAHMNGDYKKVTYTVELKDGTLKEIEMTYIKPDITGGMKLLEFNIKK